MNDSIKLIDRIRRTYEYISFRWLLAQEDEVLNKVAVELLEDLSMRIGLLDNNNYLKEESMFEHELSRAKSYIDEQNLQDEISENPLFINGKKKYIKSLELELSKTMDYLKNSISGYSIIENKIEEHPDAVVYNTYKEKGILLLIRIYKFVIKDLKDISTSSSKPIPLIQQMLIIDKLGVINNLYDDGVNQIDISRLLSALLNQNQTNITKHLRHGCDLYDPNPVNADDMKFRYKTPANEEDLLNTYKKLNIEHLI